MPQMKKMSCTYGAPLGRRSYGKAQDCAPRSIRLFKVDIDSSGYDDGGAYWGLGDPIYCATDDADYFETVRASNRVHAALLMNIERDRLKAGLQADTLQGGRKVFNFLRWSVEYAYIGQPLPVWQISEFGKPLGYVLDWHDLCHFAQTCSYSQGSSLQTGEGLNLFRKA